MSKRMAGAACGVAVIVMAGRAVASENDPSWRAGVQSPGGQVRLELMLAGDDARGPALCYRVTFNGHPIVLDSPLEVELADGTFLGVASSFEHWKTAPVRAVYSQVPGKRSHVIDSCSEGLLTLRERSEPGRRWQVACRVYDDAVALRYVFPSQAGWFALSLAGERTRFALPPDARGLALPLNSFTTSYEKRYECRLVREIPRAWLLGLPLLLELPGAGWAAITEANLTDYAGMYLARDDRGDATLVSRLAPRPGEPALAVRADLPHVSPWRVILIGQCVDRLIESDVVLNLNAPCAIADTSWIRTGKTTFPWWNGYYEEGVPFEPGLNTATAKYYIDFCAAARIPYHSLDGKGGTAWYGGPIAPYEGADPTTAVAGLDLPEVLRYAKAKGVGIRLWMHWQAAQTHMARAFPLYREWGVQGVMLDFMNRDDQEMVNFMHQALRTAAENHLTVVFHGVSKPTGLERTWPNLLTSEGVLNLEYDKWDKLGVSPEHEIVVACTRMLAGPLDFHQGSFRTVPVAAFKPRNVAPVIMGTPCRTLASYVVFQNHLAMVADYPSAYRGHPGLAVLSAIPTTWDDTRVLEAIPGEVIVIARRCRDTWWIGGMTNREPRELRLSLQFLAAERYAADIYRDDISAKYGLEHVAQELDAVQSLRVTLAPAGGFVVRLKPSAR
jgi:alpha-glucosidase